MRMYLHIYTDDTIFHMFINTKATHPLIAELLPSLHHNSSIGKIEICRRKDEERCSIHEKHRKEQEKRKEREKRKIKKLSVSFYIYYHSHICNKESHTHILFIIDIVILLVRVIFRTPGNAFIHSLFAY